MRMKKFPALLLTVLCAALTSCTNNGENIEDVSEAGVSLSETVTSTNTESTETTASGTAVGNTLMAKASPDTSALLFSCYDGENVHTFWLFDNRGEKNLLKRISEVPAEKTEEWSPELFDAPAYGFHIGDTDGWSLDAVWSNGYWITQDGDAYCFDYDFSVLSEEYAWEDEHVFSSAAALPCAHIICRNGDEWFADRLSPVSNEKAAPDHISLELVEQTKDMVDVKYTNNGSENWEYGYFYSLEVCLDGKWYSVPQISGNYAFPAVAVILEAGHSQNFKYTFDMYGDIPPGQYRISANDCVVEFTVL